MSYWVVPPEWSGETAFILGGGPSLAREDLRPLFGRRVIAINNSYQIFPHADVLYFADSKWYMYHKQRVMESFEGRYIVTTVEVDGAVKRLRNAGQIGWSNDPGALYTGANGTYQSMQVAFHFGVKRIVLLGVDMRVVDGRTHWHPGHQHVRQTQAGYANVFEHTMLPLFQNAVAPLKEAGVEVINTSKESALKLWPYKSLTSVLREAL